MMVKLVSVESYILGFSIVSRENPDIYKCRNSQGLFPGNSQLPSMPFHLFISVPTFVMYISKMTSRGCVNSSESFCYFCGEFVVKKQQRNITDFVEKVYFAYFGVKIGDQDKSWALHGVCLGCVERFRMWSKGKVKSFRFGVPMIWREPQNHSDDCYFCSCNVQGYSIKIKKQISYPNMDSPLRPVPHGLDDLAFLHRKHLKA